MSLPLPGGGVCKADGEGSAVRLGSPNATKVAQVLRCNMSPPEQLLWQALRRNQFGVRFRRQHPAGPYILDFFCARARLCIEVDGDQHDFIVTSDRKRDKWLARQGTRTLRIKASDVLRDLGAVLAWIGKEVSSPSVCSAATSPW